RLTELGGQSFCVRSALVAPIRSRSTGCARVGDEHPLLLGDRQKSLGGVLAGELQFVTASIEHDELGAERAPSSSRSTSSSLRLSSQKSAVPGSLASIGMR